MKKGSWAPQKAVVAQLASLTRLQGPEDVSKSSLLEPKPTHSVEWTENIAKVRIDGESSWTLLDSGSTRNAVTPEFVEVCSLDIGPLGDLADSTLGINCFGVVFSQPLGDILIRMQVEGVWGYNEDQVALVIPDSTIFGSQVPVSLGAPIINQIINVIKESDIDELSAFLNG